jgi:hypothetical protein
MTPESLLSATVAFLVVFGIGGFVGFVGYWWFIVIPNRELGH